jgi:hypothetical protein
MLKAFLLGLLGAVISAKVSAETIYNISLDPKETAPIHIADAYKVGNVAVETKSSKDVTIKDPSPKNFLKYIKDLLLDTEEQRVYVTYSTRKGDSFSKVKYIVTAWGLSSSVEQAQGSYFMNKISRVIANGDPQILSFVGASHSGFL